MTFSLTAILPLPDMLALGWFFLCWVGYAWYADHRRVTSADSWSNIDYAHFGH